MGPKSQNKPQKLVFSKDDQNKYLLKTFYLELTSNQKCSWNNKIKTTAANARFVTILYLCLRGEKQFEKKKIIAREAISKLSWLGKNGRGKPSHLHLWTPKPVHSKTSDSPGLGWMPSGTQYSNLFSRCLHWAGCEDLTVVWSYSYCVDGESREANEPHNDWHGDTLMYWVTLLEERREYSSLFIFPVKSMFALPIIWTWVTPTQACKVFVFSTNCRFCKMQYEDELKRLLTVYKLTLRTVLKSYEI